MARREKFGKLVLLAGRHSGPLGVESLAARLGPGGLDRLVSVLRFRTEVSEHPEAVRHLTDEARRAARLHDPGLLRVLGVGKVGPTFYVSFEHVEGRALAAIIDRCRADRFPFAADNALLVASRAATTLDFLHRRRDESGRSLFHGLLTPDHLFVTYAGEVKLTGLGVWAGLRDTGLIAEPERHSLAPEQREGGEGDARSDVYALGLLLLEMLTLERPSTPVTVSSLSEARVVGPAGDPEPIPPPVNDILRRALAEDPAARYSGIAELRNAVDSLLFSGDLSSTTFNLAFFMHTLFRQDIEREAAEVEEARGADYSEFLGPPPSPNEELPPAPVLPATDGTPAAEPPPFSTASPEPAAGTPSWQTAPPAPEPVSGSPAEPGQGEARLLAPGDSSPRLSAPASGGSEESRPAPPPGESTGGPSSTLPGDSSARHRRPAAGRSSPEGSAPGRVPRRSGGRGSTPRPASARGAAPSTSRRGLVLMLAALLAVVFGGGVGYVSFLESPTPASTSPTTTLSPEGAAALLRVHELEARIAELEREKAGGEQQEGEAAAEHEPASSPVREAEATATEEQVRAREAARAEARRRAQAERERREAELVRLEEEKRTAEALLVREQEAVSAPAASPLLPTVAPPPPTPAPAPLPVERGSLVEYSDPQVTPPVLLKEARLFYPPAALRAKTEGSVVVEALVDETGRVTDARVIEPAPSRVGFEDAALRMVRGRRYEPATKLGVPVKVRVRVRVDFTLAE